MDYLNLLARVALVALLIVSAHYFYSSAPPASYTPELNAEWEQFQQDYGMDQYGADGYFTRAARSGHALVNKTYDHAWRFTRKGPDDAENSCAACHTPEQLAYAFVNSDRFDPKLGKRVSFEERVMRCYVTRMDGFVPTIYDPAVRDIRIYARTVARQLELREGTMIGGAH